MKKTILSLAAVLMTSGLSMAQFTFVPDAVTPTGLTFTGNTLPAGTAHGQFYVNQAYANPEYIDAGCTSVTTTVGGFGPILDSGTGGRTTGISFYGGDLATVYFNEPWMTCAPHIPSFGFQTGTSAGIGTGYEVDLSDPANQRIKFTYTSDVAWNLELQLFDGAYNVKLATVPVVLQVGTHDIDIDFSTKLLTDNASVSTIRQVSLLHNSSTFSSSAFGVSLSNIQLGSATVTGLNNSTSVANANLYPNPSTGTTTISGELKSVADVKITLVDMLGQEVKVIAEERTSTINTTFDVATLKKGIYSVVTNIDGAPAKSQMLVVR